METESITGLGKHGLLRMLGGSAYHGQDYCFWSKTNTHLVSTVAPYQSQISFSQQTFINRQRENSLSDFFCFFEKTSVRNRFLKVVSKWF